MPDYIESARNLTADQSAHPDVPGAVGQLKDQLDAVVAGTIETNIYGVGERNFAVDEALVEGSAKLQILTATAAGLAVSMPDATGAAMILGQPWLIRNPAGAANGYALKDYAGGILLAELAPGQQAVLYLSDDAAAAGVWQVAAPAAGGRLNLNGDGRVAQIAMAATADDTYAWDGHYILTQTGTVTPDQLIDVADGIPFMMRLTQSQATAQRMGLATIIEGNDCKHLRGGNAVLSGKVRISNSQAIRYAILEWTGTEDAVTSDVVNDWTSGVYTAGNFFLGASLTVTAVGTITPAANTVTDLTELTGAISSSMNNAILLLWTEAVAAQNVTLDVLWQFQEGAVATPYEHRPLALELAHCKRYFERLAIEANQQLAVGTQVSTTRSTFPIRYEVEKRAAPTIAITAADWDVWVDGATVKAVSSASADLINTHTFRFDATGHAAGGATGQAANLAADNAATRYIDISARL